MRLEWLTIAQYQKMEKNGEKWLANLKNATLSTFGNPN
jgi:hypothetical protein